MPSKSCEWVWEDDHYHHEEGSVNQEGQLPQEGLPFTELDRVKSCRMEQESKITEFISQDKLQCIWKVSEESD